MEAWEAVMEDVFLEDIGAEVYLNPDEVGTPLVAVYPMSKCSLCRLSLTWQVQDFRQKYWTPHQMIERVPTLIAASTRTSSY